MKTTRLDFQTWKKEFVAGVRAGIGYDVLISTSKLKKLYRAHGGDNQPFSLGRNSGDLLVGEEIAAAEERAVA